MKINKTKFRLTENNFFSKPQTKNKIVLRNSSTKDMKFFNGWLLRRNGEYKKVTPYTVDRDGRVYEHYDPNYYSEFMGTKTLDKETIGITLVNQGWLKKDYFGPGCIRSVYRGCTPNAVWCSIDGNMRF